MPISYRILGPLEVTRDGKTLSLGGAKQRAVMGDLLIHANQVVSVDRLIDDLWGEEPPETAGNVLQVHISGLRKAMGHGAEQVLVTRRPGYLLAVGPGELDLDRFEALAAEGRAVLLTDATKAAAALAEALELFHGPPLAEFAFEAFAQGEITRLEELRASVIEDRIDADLILSRHGKVIGELQGLIASQPLRERPRAQLILALYRSGRQAEALEASRAFREHLAEELGIDPSPELQHLETAILNQDPDLLLPGSAAAPVPPAQASTAPSLPAPRETAPESPAPRSSRRVVTVLFCDVAGSTSLAERIDPEAMRGVMGRYFGVMRAVLERHGATVEKFIGDAVMAVFGIPAVHEDDAMRAVRAAAEMQSGLAQLNAELEGSFGVAVEARIGVNTGEVVAGDPAVGETLVTGDGVNVAARLQQSASPGDVLIGASTYRMVRDAVTAEATEPFEVKGKSAPVAAYRLIEVTEHPAPARRFDVALVGRARELRVLADACERSVADRACQLVTILGVAGVGKSRLTAEALAALPKETTILTGRCLPYGDGITFWPVGEIVRAAAAITEADSADEARAKVEALATDEERGPEVARRVFELIGLAEPSSTLEESFWAVRLMLEALARRAPLVVVIDDLHWAEPALLDLIEHLADWSRDAPITLVGLARPEFLESRPGWAGGKLNATSFSLEALGATESEALVNELLDGSELSRTLRSRLLEASGGNPLFVEETLAELIDAGHLVRDGEAWRETSPEAEVTIPPTIAALLAARLDRLGTEERTVIEGASVVGQEFYREAVAELAPEVLRPDVGTYLRALVRKDLVRPDRSTFAGQETYRFRHILIRDAAYAAMPKRVRAELHERFARWLQRIAGDRLPEYEEIVGYHLEQSVSYRRELGSDDDHTQALAVEAGQALGHAGSRAEARDDYRAAVSLLERAIALLPRQNPDRIEYLMSLAQGRVDHGDVPGANQAIDQAIREAEEAENPALIWRARLAKLRLEMFEPAVDWPHRARRLADEAIVALEQIGDEAGLARAWQLFGGARLTLGRIADWVEASERVVRYARRAYQPALEQSGLCWISSGVDTGPTPVPEAIARCERILQETETSSTRLWVLRSIAALVARQGDFDRARSLVAEAESGLRELGALYDLSLQGGYEYTIEFLAGDWAAAAEGLLRAIDDKTRVGDQRALPELAALLADVRYRQGRYDEAAQHVDEARTGDSLEPYSSAVSRSVEAKLLARRGLLIEAEALSRQAAAIAGRTDQIELQADMQLDLAEILRIAGRQGDAIDCLREAAALHERKGNVVMAARASSLLEECQREGNQSPDR